MKCMTWTKSKTIFYKLFVFCKYSSFYNSVSAIKIIIKNRVPDRLHVNPYLVSAAGLQPAFYQRYIIKSFKNFVSE